MAIVAVVGAGVAGLAAAAHLRALGCTPVVLEASGRIGGRTWTTRPPELHGQVFDEGAVWLHDAERNPLVPVAEAAGFPLTDADAVRQGRTWLADRWASEAERRDLDAAWSRFEAEADRRLAAPGADGTLADVADRLGDDPWALTVESWEGPVIAAAPARALSLRDWRNNLLGGGNLMLADGMGDFIARALGADVAVHCGVAARRVREGQRRRLVIETDAGDLDAAGCIVTVSTGVLQAEAIRFAPALPPRTGAAIADLPMGRSIKVALRAEGPDRLDLPAFTTLDRRIERRGDPLVLVNAWPFGRAYVSAWIGADAADALDGPEAAAALVRGQMRAMFGARADRLFGAATPHVTCWTEDALIRGAYAYARPGRSAARTELAEPVWDGRLAFAGEAVHPTLGGTVGGAYLAGQAAAARMAATLAMAR